MREDFVYFFLSDPDLWPQICSKLLVSRLHSTKFGSSTAGLISRKFKIVDTGQMDGRTDGRGETLYAA